MMKKLVLVLIWSFSIFIPTLSEAQTSAPQLGNYSDEQIHLQLSESIVGVGESIWFQANITNTDSIAALSRVVYLELFNQQQVAVVQGTYQASFGIALGELALPDSLGGGWYQLRAYTQYMRNGHSHNFFTQPILVVNSDLNNPSPEAQFERSVFSLHPEGGNWRANQENTVVTLVPGIANYPDTSRIEVIKAVDSTVVSSTPISEELGTFNFAPQTDSTYLARLITSDTSYISIPEAQLDDYTLQVSLQGRSLQVKGANSSGREKYLAIRSNTRLLYNQPINSGNFSLTVPTSNLRGLIELAILDNRDEVSVQRLFYIDYQENHVSINLSGETASPREEISVSLTNKTDLGDASLSLTVRKVHLASHPLSVAALAHFGLSRLTLPSGVSSSQALSWINQWLVTQTSPWPSWSNILSQEPSTSTFTKEDEMLLITGRVQIPQSFDKEDQVVLSIPGDDPYFEYSEVTSDGEFAIPVSRVYGLQQSILQYKSATGDQPERLQWEVDDTFTPLLVSKFAPGYSVADDQWQQLVSGYQLRKQIQQSYYSIEEDTTVAPKAQRQFRFYGAPNVRVNPDDYISLPSFEEICRELLPGVRLIKRKGKYDFDVFDPGSRSFLPNEPTLFLDGVPIQEKDYIINFPPSEISFIETVNRRTYYGNVRLDGVVAVYTKQEKAYEEALSGKAHFTTLPYYTKSAPFSTPDSLAASVPDFRTLLYWKPKINLDTDSASTFSFTTADELGIYEVIVRGLTKQGKVVYERAVFEVKPAGLP